MPSELLVTWNFDGESRRCDDDDDADDVVIKGCDELDVLDVPDVPDVPDDGRVVGDTGR